MEDVRGEVWAVVFLPNFHVKIIDRAGETRLEGVYGDIRARLPEFLHPWEVEASVHLPCRAFKHKRPIVLERTGPGGAPLKRKTPPSLAGLSYTRYEED